MQVSALLITHNGARWLPAVLEGVSAQTAPLAHRVVVDTGSIDETPEILAGDGSWEQHSLPDCSSYAQSVEAGLAAIPEDSDWVWLLHDDSAPDPQALERLLQAAQDHPEVAVFGPKLREWPSLRRLLELGVTISGTGRRETGLERGEYDQGQHDERREVLAVNTAGMLVRRDVLTSLGFDPHLPVFGNDLDFGWRAARAGQRTMVVPDALVFHAEAAQRGQRLTPDADHHRRHERAGAMYTLLVNGPAATTPLRVIRLALGAVLRMLALLLVRAPGEAWDEAVALGSTLLAAPAIARGRKQRKSSSVVPHKEIKHLLAPWWLPYRHGLDFVSDVGQAAVNLGRHEAARRGLGTQELIEDNENYRTGPGLLALLVRNPVFWLVLVTVGVAIYSAVDVLTGQALAGGALPPAPGGAGDWWRLYFEGHHTVGAGSGAPAPAYVFPLAVLGTLALGHADVVISVLFLLSVPLTALSALRFGRRLVDFQDPSGKTAAAWGALAYGLAPLLSGAVAQGRLGTVAGAIVLPWVATSALALFAPDAEDRWRAAWRTSLGAALLTAFVPAAWIAGSVLAVVAFAVGLVRDRHTWRVPSRFGPLLLPIVVVPLLLLPWTLGVLRHPAAWLVEAGRTGVGPLHASVGDLMGGRWGGPGVAPAWWGWAIGLAAVVALVRHSSRDRVLRAWWVALLAALMVALLQHSTIRLPGTGGFVPYAGFFVVLLVGALCSAIVLASDQAIRLFAHRPLGWRAPIAALAGLAAALPVLAGLGWWVSNGLPAPVARVGAAGVPSYMTELATSDAASGILVLRGDVRSGISYRLLRSGPLRVGEDGVVAMTRPDARLTSTVGRLLAGGTAEATTLASYGVAYVFEPRPVNGAVTGALDASPGFSRASADSLADAAWRVQAHSSLASVSNDVQPFRLLWVLLELAIGLVVLVLAAPGRRRS